MVSQVQRFIIYRVALSISVLKPTFTPPPLSLSLRQPPSLLGKRRRSPVTVCFEDLANIVSEIWQQSRSLIFVDW